MNSKEKKKKNRTTYKKYKTKMMDEVVCFGSVRFKMKNTHKATKLYGNIFILSLLKNNKRKKLFKQSNEKNPKFD